MPTQFSSTRRRFCGVALLLGWAALASGAGYAAKIDERQVEKLVEQEVNRILSDETFLDPRVQQAIERIIARQQQQAEQARIDREREMFQLLRPVDVHLDHIIGPFDAPITLLEYSDFECPYCKSFHPIAGRLLSEFPHQVRWVYRHFPLGFHNPGAQKQAEASECVAELAGNIVFWRFTNAIYHRTESGGTGFALNKLRPLAEELGVDGDAFSDCLDSGQMAWRVREDLDDGGQAGITGTPATFLFNQKGQAQFLRGAVSYQELLSVFHEMSK